MKAKLIDKYYAADPITFEQMRSIVKYLLEKKDYRFCLFVACGCFMGLRVSDLLKLKYTDLEKECFFINEKKTNKLKEIAINPELRSIINQCIPSENFDKDRLMFANKDGKPLTIQGINLRLKSIKKTLSLECDNFSCHSLRKCMAVQMYNDMGRTEHALLYVGKVLNHSNSSTTIVYLGLQREKIRDLYMKLGQGVPVSV